MELILFETYSTVTLQHRTEGVHGNPVKKAGLSCNYYCFPCNKGNPVMIRLQDNPAFINTGFHCIPPVLPFLAVNIEYFRPFTQSAICLSIV